jgi:hypothetical protein
MTTAQTQTSPPGIIESLSAGFNAVAQKPVLLLIPLLLDLFLWLGPRLSMAPVVSDLKKIIGATAAQTADNRPALFDQNVDHILDSYNLFSALSTWPLGTPSLLAGNKAGSGPLGSPGTIAIKAMGELAAWMLGLVLAGLLLGSLYLGLIARSTQGDPPSLSTWASHTWLYWGRIVALVFLVLVGAFLLSVLFFLTVEIIAMVTAPLASLALLVGIGMGMWGLFHLFFAAHGILLNNLGVRQAVRNSVSIVRRYRISSAGLLLVAVVIGLGLANIWNIPPSESWMRLIAIIGHAFVNTGLVTATFFFYRERTNL